MKSPEKTINSEDDYPNSEEEIGLCQRLKYLSPKSIKPDNCKTKSQHLKREIFNV